MTILRGNKIKKMRLSYSFSILARIYFARSKNKNISPSKNLYTSGIHVITVSIKGARLMFILTDTFQSDTSRLD